MYRLVEDMRYRLAHAFPQQAGSSGSSNSSSSSSSSSSRSRGSGGEEGGGEGGAAGSEADWPPIRVAGYGHLGDGNLHLNVSGVRPSCQAAAGQAAAAAAAGCGGGKEAEGEAPGAPCRAHRSHPQRSTLVWAVAVTRQPCLLLPRPLRAAPAYSEELRQQIEPFVYEWTAQVGGPACQGIAPCDMQQPSPPQP